MVHFLFIHGVYPAIWRTNSWLFAQESFLVGLGGQFGMPGIDELIACRANTLSAIPSLQLCYCINFKWILTQKNIKYKGLTSWLFEVPILKITTFISTIYGTNNHKIHPDRIHWKEHISLLGYFCQKHIN